MSANKVARSGEVEFEAAMVNRLKAAESDLHQDVDLSQVLVKPEDTAGVPKGWGKSEKDANL